MHASLAGMLDELTQGLRNMYGAELRGVYLFGSQARGDMDAESDVDVLIVLGEIARYAAEVDRTGALVSQLSLEHGVSISRVFVTDREWQSGDSPFLRNVRREAVPA